MSECSIYMKQVMKNVHPLNLFLKCFQAYEIFERFQIPDFLEDIFFFFFYRL